MIKFKKLRWKNFLSTGNVFTEIQLDRSPSTIITGENGAGKSTILDALCFVLFNKPFRNINKGQLMNSINEKGLLAEIDFTIGNVEYMVRRGIKPAVFEITKNGNLLDQPGSVRDYQTQLEDTILKLNYKSFTQIVVLGNASFTPFMQLTTKDRREVIEDLLDIQIFSHMNTLLKDRVARNKTDKQEVEYQIELLGEKIDVQKEYLAKVTADIEKQKQELQSELDEWRTQIASATVQQQTCLANIDELSATIADADKVNNKSTKISELLMKLHDKIAKAEKRIRFYEKHDSCPTCEQVIDATTKANQLETVVQSATNTRNAIDELQLQQVSLNEEIERISSVQSEITSAQQYWRDLQTQVSTYEGNAERLQAKIDSLAVEDQITEDSPTSKISELEMQLKSTEDRSETLAKDFEVLKIATEMLRDGGIKKKIIRQYVPIINKLVNKYLAALDFFVNFELDEEFNEVIKSRYRDEFSYASFSEGEKMRIDLALLFTWRAVAKLKNSTNTNLLILDEVFDASLDTSGCDEFLKLLQEIGGDTNVFVISHKGDVLTDKFRSQIRFEKVKNFSRMAV
ncbi:MAG: AAA family ATPase [Candidatus Poseidoniales archaeon]